MANVLIQAFFFVISISCKYALSKKWKGNIFAIIEKEG